MAWDLISLIQPEELLRFLLQTTNIHQEELDYIPKQFEHLFKKIETK